MADALLDWAYHGTTSTRRCPRHGRGQPLVATNLDLRLISLLSLSRLCESSEPLSRPSHHFVHAVFCCCASSTTTLTAAKRPLFARPPCLELLLDLCGGMQPELSTLPLYGMWKRVRVMKPRDARRRATLAQPRTKALECCETTTVLALTLRLSLFGETKGVPKAA